MPTETWKRFSDNNSRKTCSMTIIFDWHKRFGKVERTPATISGVGDPLFPTVLRLFKSQLRVTRFQNREELKFAVRSAVAKLGVGFYKDVYRELVERQYEVSCAIVEALILAKECKT